jgi:hypothetical protein
LGVALSPPEGILILLGGGFIGVLSCVGALVDLSETGGEGGVGVSETVSAVETDFVSAPGGVLISGDDATESGDRAISGEFGAVMSVEMVGRLRALCFFNLSCMISASILRSDSSSRSL